MDRSVLENVSESKRKQVEAWWESCRDQNIDEFSFAFFLDAPITDADIAAFLLPVPGFEEVARRVSALFPLTSGSEPASDETLLAALRDVVAELSRVARAFGHDDLADRADAVAEFRVVDTLVYPQNQALLGPDILLELGDAVRDDAFGQDDRAVANTKMVLSEWLPMPWMSIDAIAPLLRVDSHLSAHRRLDALRAESLVTDAVAEVARFPAP